MRPIYQGFALRWMNGWAFGPNDFPYFCAEQNRPAGSAEQGCKFHRFCAGHSECAGYILPCFPGRLHCLRHPNTMRESVLGNLPVEEMMEIMKTKAVSIGSQTKRTVPLIAVLFAGIVTGNFAQRLGPRFRHGFGRRRCCRYGECCLCCAPYRSGGYPPGRDQTASFPQSAIFPGTVRDVSVFIPAQYDGSKPACVYVKTDGYNPDEKKRSWKR